MMRSPNGNGGDSVQGKVYRGKKWDVEKKKFVEGKFFNLALFEIDASGQPIVVGKVTLKNGEEADKHRIVKVFRVAESSLLKVANGESKSCNIYYSER